jgi:hypothetical protein
VFEDRWVRAPINVHAELLRYGGMGVYQRGGGRLILAEGAGPGGVEAGVPEFIDRQMELPYGHGAYFYMKGPFHQASLGAALQRCETLADDAKR